jgi:hypothetical protein
MGMGATEAAITWMEEADAAAMALPRPTCPKCGHKGGRGYVPMDDGGGQPEWRCDECLTEQQRKAWCRDLWREARH